MALFAIADTHLSIGVPSKPMDIFKGWENHLELLEKNWKNTVSDNDTVVIAGDISWGMSLLQAKPDFAFLNDLPGKEKIILKGNHDYWWTSLTKMNKFFSENDFSTLKILHNNCCQYGGYAVCGTRGWVNMPDEPKDMKVLAREAMRLETSIKSALELKLEPIVFMHYPPMFAGNYNYDILDVLYKYKIKRCFYGHLHGGSHKYAINGTRDDIDFRLVSCDFVQFSPVMVL